MWHLLWDLLLVGLGVGIGVILMSILVVGKLADGRIEEMERSNEE